MPQTECGRICGNGDLARLEEDLAFAGVVEHDLAAIAEQWPAERLNALRSTESGMLDGPLAAAMMQKTPCDPELPQIGLAVNYIRSSSCHTHTKDGIGRRTEGYIDRLGLASDTFFIPGVNDGVTNGYSEMSMSLISRDGIANLTQIAAEGAGVNGVVAIPACDKGFPGFMMAAAIMDRPFVIVPGGSAQTGRDPESGDKLGILNVFHAEAAFEQGLITAERRQEIIDNSINVGNCNGVFTADTMAAMNEIIGLGIVGSANNIAEHMTTDYIAIRSIDALMHAIEDQTLPSHLITKESLDNAFTLLATIGGSTNAVLHLLALAKVAQVPYRYTDMKKIFARTPFRLKMQPNAPDGFWEDYVLAGGVASTIAQLLHEGRLHADVPTMNPGMTLGDAYADVERITPFSKDGPNDFFFPEDNPILEKAHLTILFGNLAENGCVMKVNDPEKLRFSGEAIVFETEQSALKALGQKNAYKKFNGKVVIIRNLGPRAAGMPELLKVDKALQSLQNAQGEHAQTMLVSDARQSGGAGHPNVTHVSPEAYVGGTIGVVKNGDWIDIDAGMESIHLNVSDEEIASRKAAKKTPKIPARVGAAALFAASALGAEEGATILAPSF